MGLDTTLTANHNPKILRNIKSMFLPIHFLLCRLPSKLLTVRVRDCRLNLPDLSVTLRGAPSEETLNAAELEVE